MHPNTVRAWTDQGRLPCVRINDRGDRRYRAADLERFLAAGRPDGVAGDDLPHVAETQAQLSLIAHAAPLADATDEEEALRMLADLLHERAGHEVAVTDEHGFRPLAGAASPDSALVRRARRSGQPAGTRTASGQQRVALPLALPGQPGAVLLVEQAAGDRLGPAVNLATLRVLATHLNGIAAMLGRQRAAEHARQRAELLLAIRDELAAQPDVAAMLRMLLERVRTMFGVRDAAVLRPMPGVEWGLDLGADLPPALERVLEQAPADPAVARALAANRIVSLPGRGTGRPPTAFEKRLQRAKVGTLTVVPLAAHEETLAALLLCRGERRPWSADELATLREISGHAADVMRNGRNYSQMAYWAAQLESIQALGSRLSRLRTVDEIGRAIALELDQLIACHNVRVYRLIGDTIEPIAFLGRVGEYEDENKDMLRLTIGQGITGWVARHGVAQNVPDASADPRSMTIPGTEDNLPESLLLAPMIYEDQVLGVIVLAKLGLHQFSSDDLRMLEIYALFAAQALTNAESTERLRAQSDTLARQLRSQQELLRVTESILGTLDTPTLLEEISVRLDALMSSTSICVAVCDTDAGVLRPLFARGVNTDRFLARVTPLDEGVGGLVVRTGEATLISDMLRDQRVTHFDETAPQAGALVVAPLRARDHVTGVLTIERLGENATFSDEEFELVKLFAGHVSIALQNATAHRAVELRAETDSLTGLWNHGALIQHLERAVATSESFSLLMIDLDNFKLYNDHHGHQAGDEALRRIASALRRSGRHTDEVFRYGGDEFAILLPETPAPRALTVGRKVLSAVSRFERSTAARITCSIGVASCPEDGCDAATVLLAADRACYAAKRAGGARAYDAEAGRELAPDLTLPPPTPVESAEPAYDAA